MKYKSVLVTRRGGLEVIRIVENEMRAPQEYEARIRILATPVCQDDIAIRVGNRPFLAKTPFVPGYTFIGVVEAVGEKVSSVTVGDRVAGITQYGSHAEMIYWDARQLVQMPASIDPVAAAPLILNYLVAYQTMHRVVQVKAGDRVLIVGASGGVGTAFLQLGKLAGLKMYGLASAGKHATLAEYGATPIDYRQQDFVKIIRAAEPNGLDYVFNGMGESYFGDCLAVLRRGGVLVHYGGPQSFASFLLLVVKLIGNNLLLNGKSIKGYGTHREDVQEFKDDWTALFTLLQAGKIKPVIAAKFPLSQAVRAYELLESGQVTGNLVLLAPQLLAGQ